jgi:plastocyanin
MTRRVRYPIQTTFVRFRAMPTTAWTRWISTAMLLALCAAPLGCERRSEAGRVADPTAVADIRKALAGESSGTGAAEAAKATGWATLKGKFTYEGEPPTMPPYDVNKDQATCAPGVKAPSKEYLVVDAATKGIANIAIYPRNVTDVHPDAQASSEAVEFDQKVCRFLTHVFAFSVGQPVTLKNSDDVGHNTNISGRNTFNQTIPVAASVPWTAQREEAVPVLVKCSIHPWMVAHMLPRENRYFAVTVADGSFEIPNLPAGVEVEIQVWHESGTGTQHELIVETDAAKELKWSKKGRIKIKLEENEVREINIAVPPSAFRAG